MSRRPSPRQGRPMLLRGALILAFGAVLLLGMIGIKVAVYFRTTAIGVVQDNTALAGDRLAEVVSAGLAQRIAPLLSVIRPHALGPGPPLSPADLRKIGGRTDPLASSVERVFRWDSAANTILVSGGALDSTLHRRLRELISQASKDLPKVAYFGLDWPRTRTEPVIAYDLIRNEDGSSHGFYGLSVPVDTLEQIFSRITAGRQFLPRRVADRIAGDSAIGFRLTARGRVLFDRRYDSSSPYRSETDLGFMFGHLAAQVALDPGQASGFVVGGLPRYQTRLLTGFLGLSIASLLLLALIVRRERNLQRLREDFVAGVSHELRTPLAQLRLFSETLALGRVRSEEERTRSLEIIRQETQRLAHLVENPLLFSRRERSTVALELERIDLSGLVDRILDEFSPLAEGCLAREIEPRIEAEVDAGAVRQVVLNLLDNALKYGSGDQIIRVRLRKVEGGAELTVADQGPGVPPEHRQLVWQRFWRGTMATERGIGGTGIGLAIVADLVRAHGGEVSVGDAEPSGARFAIRLPLEQNGRPR